MNHAEASLMFPSHAHIYLNPTPLQAINCPVDKHITEVNGVTLLATYEPYPALAAKELLPE